MLALVFNTYWYGAVALCTVSPFSCANHATHATVWLRECCHPHHSERVPEDIWCSATRHFHCDFTEQTGCHDHFRAAVSSVPWSSLTGPGAAPIREDRTFCKNVFMSIVYGATGWFRVPLAGVGEGCQRFLVNSNTEKKATTSQVQIGAACKQRRSRRRNVDAAHHQHERERETRGFLSMDRRTLNRSESNRK